MLSKRPGDTFDPVTAIWIGVDISEQEPREVGKLAEPLDLLLHDRRGAANELLLPVVARLTEEPNELVRVLAHRESAQVDPVHPVELLVVERSRARYDALELEALDQLVARHDRRLVVVAPAEQREEVHER